MVADSGWQPLLWSGETGADGFAPDAVAAVALANRFMADAPVQA